MLHSTGIVTGYDSCRDADKADAVAALALKFMRPYNVSYLKITHGDTGSYIEHFKQLRPVWRIPCVQPRGVATLGFELPSILISSVLHIGAVRRSSSIFFSYYSFWYCHVLSAVLLHVLWVSRCSQCKCGEIVSPPMA